MHCERLCHTGCIKDLVFEFWGFPWAWFPLCWQFPYNLILNSTPGVRWYYNDYWNWALAILNGCSSSSKQTYCWVFGLMLNTSLLIKWVEFNKARNQVIFAGLQYMLWPPLHCTPWSCLRQHFVMPFVYSRAFIKQASDMRLAYSSKLLDNMELVFWCPRFQIL